MPLTKILNSYSEETEIPKIPEASLKKLFTLISFYIRDEDHLYMPGWTSGFQQLQALDRRNLLGFSIGVVDGVHRLNCKLNEYGVKVAASILHEKIDEVKNKIERYEVPEEDLIFLADKTGDEIYNVDEYRNFDRQHLLEYAYPNYKFSMNTNILIHSMRS